MIDFNLKEFLSITKSSFELAGMDAAPDSSISGVSIDTRTLSPGNVYFAIRGERLDGHAYIAEAVQKKAAACIVDRRWWNEKTFDTKHSAFFIVNDTVTALQDMAHFYRNKFSVPVLGLTGTNGKTTTKEMMAAVLKNRGPVCKTEGNLNNHLGLPLTLFRLERSHTTAIIEMGTNHFGEIAKLSEIAQPQYGLITNIGHGHLEFLHDLDGVAKAKTELFDYLQPDGLAFVNLDDARLAKKARDIRKKVTYGFSENADVTATKQPPDDSGCAQMEVQGETVTLNVPGDHNLANALAAIAVGLEFGVEMSDIKKSLKRVELPAKRMEKTQINRVLILNDSYNANPESTLAALEILHSTPCEGKKIFIFGDMLELGASAEAEHAKIGRSLENYAVDVFFAYGPCAAAAVKAAGQRKGTMRAQHFETKPELTEELKALVQEGDLLLFKGSRGMRMEEVLENLWPKNIFS